MTFDLFFNKFVKKLKKGVAILLRFGYNASSLSFWTDSKKGRGVAQLVEHRSPKPRATGSIPVAPAIFRKGKEYGKKGYFYGYDESNRLFQAS